MATQIQPTAHITELPRAKRELKRLKKRYPGVLREVADRLRVRAGTVSHVFAGDHASAKITSALLETFNRRMDEEQAKKREAESMTAA